MKKVLVMVDCISTYRMRYCVEAPADHPEYALDTVTMQTAKEFSQEWLGETIVSHRVVPKEEALKMFDEDNECFSSWSEEQKIQNCVTSLEDQGYEIEHSKYYYDTDRNK